MALADAPGAASFAIGGYAPMSGTLLCGPAPLVVLPPAHALATMRATTGSTVRRTDIQRRRCTSDVPIRSERTASAGG